MENSVAVKRKCLIFEQFISSFGQNSQTKAGRYNLLKQEEKIYDEYFLSPYIAGGLLQLHLHPKCKCSHAVQDRVTQKYILDLLHKCKVGGLGLRSFPT